MRARCLRHRRRGQYFGDHESRDRRVRQAGAAEPQHRGAAGADESTGDGAGILMQIPHEFFARRGRRLGFELPARRALRRGHALPAPRRRASAAACEADSCRRSSRPKGLTVLGWRDVPTRQPLLGRDRPQRRAGDPPGLHRRQGRQDEELERRLLRRPQADRAPRARDARRSRPTTSTSPRCRAARSSTRACSWRRSCSPTIPIWPTRDVHDGPGHRPPALQHEHVPELAAGPAVPHDRPQRRDQHAARQRQPAAGLREDDGLRRP